jgi:hypothetical protein
LENLAQWQTVVWLFCQSLRTLHTIIGSFPWHSPLPSSPVHILFIHLLFLP